MLAIPSALCRGLIECAMFAVDVLLNSIQDFVSGTHPMRLD